jgi:hypothetical protein
MFGSPFPPHRGNGAGERSHSGGRKERDINLPTRPRPLLRLFTLIVLSVGLVFTAGAAQATATIRPVAWGGCGGACAVPSDLSGGTAIAAGSDFSLALKDDGTVVAWGCGFNYGECSVPIGLSAVTAIAAGHFHSLALKGDGTVAAWGCGGSFDYGQCTVPGGLTGVTAIAAGVSHSLALKSDGTVVAWGCGAGQDHGQCSVPIGLSGVTAIAAGTVHSLALKSDGTVVPWGCGFDYGQCSVPIGLSGVTAIAAGHTQSLALKSDGTVVAWGCGDFDYGQCSVPNGLSGVTAIAAGYGHSLALKGDGTVAGWGCGPQFNFGQCTPPGGLFGVTAISAGDFHSLALGFVPTNQTITFGVLADKTYGDPDFTVSGTASSGLAVSYAASGDCSVSGPTVHLKGPGLCTVIASQPGNPYYNPAPAVLRAFAIAKASQTIGFGSLPNRTYGSQDFNVSATASSGLPVSFSASGNCTVSGATMHLTGAGSCTVTASQPGDVAYNAAADVSQTFSIAMAPRKCTVPNVVGKRVSSAKLTIAKKHCRTGKVGFAYSTKRKRGIVLSQGRRPGRVLPANSKINLIVSRGRRS